jgi:hypothetical protein
VPIGVFPPSRRTLGQLISRFALQQDNWNDFSFQTLYHLYYRAREPGADVVQIGPVKILQHGQRRSDGLLITQLFEDLPADFCSIGASLDYYKRLNELPKEDKDEILRALRDVVAAPGFCQRLRQLADTSRDGVRSWLF